MAQSKNSIQADIDLVETLKMLSQAYEEISVLKMQRVRGSVLSTRDFLERLSQVFTDVRRNYKRQIQQLSKHKKIDPNRISFSTLAKNKKTVSIFISANANFYGDIVRRVFNLFIENVRKNDTDVVILGKLGKQLYENSGVNKPYKYYDIPDNDANLTHLKSVVEQVIQYEKVNVFYGRFDNMVNQQATSSDVSGELALDLSGGDDDSTRQDYYFEPSLKKILEFFESSVFTSMFEQTVHEAELSRLASRIKAMEESLGNIEKTEAELNADRRRLDKSLQNKRQLDTLTKVIFLVK